MKKNIHKIESKTLEQTQQEVFNNSRLACAIKLKPWMNEMIITQIRHKDYSDFEKITSFTEDQTGTTENYQKHKNRKMF
jgi:hypothetical protein